MKAMIFAAGLGTRLQPITNTKPKALVEVNGIPLLEIVIKRLIKFGFKDIVINVHHFADQIYAFLKQKQNFGVQIAISDEQDLLLNTGGGILKAWPLLNDGEPVLIHNVDILTSLDLRALYEFHCLNKPLATLAVKERSTSRSLLINNEHELCGWHNNITNQLKLSKGAYEELKPYPFTGVHVISQEIFELITERGVFSIMDVYLRLAKNHKILTYVHNQDFWLDLGKKQNIEEASMYLDQLI